MNVCLIAYTFYEVDFRVRRYADALAEAGYEVDVFVLRRKGQGEKEILNGVTIYHLQEREYNEKGLRSFLYRMGTFWVKVFVMASIKGLTKRYKMVHVHNPPDFLVFSAALCKLNRAKIVFDMHENLPEFYCEKFNKDPDSFLVNVLKLFEKMATRYSDFTVVAHDLLRERVMRRDGIPREKCLALLNYPQMAFFRPQPEKKEKTGLRIIYPGTVSYYHGVDIAVKAMAIVTKECKAATLDIYMRSWSIAYYQELLRLVKELNLGGNISFCGPVALEEMSEIFCRADIGIVPKRGGIFGSEAFSTKILEFMAAGLPVIVSRTKIDEFYFDDSMVMFFEPENEKDLARCILELFRDSTKRENLARNGKSYASHNNWGIRKQIYLDAVKRLVG